ncbi:PQQ-binding-like beta-propeller repeat protein [Streptomyces bobili]|uniref:outer membrane protein assembly factor BamB family protein n=1 Tax=Streptomyces bobili TaxID=67280 RepID=UPI00225033E4|nr:PQQ-binding-like beta-propeller repeat protein [Streptomyces bobili]MCX5524912.1 PQQ-like beta-propeller repeat protein [Streptomyces bobili]
MTTRTTADIGPGRERRSSGRQGAGRRLRPLLAAVTALLTVGLAAGCSDSGGSLRVVWEAPVDSGAMKYGNGAWLVGDTLVRSRYDAVTAVDARTGKGRWEYAPPGREHVCAVSRRTAGSVVLIARGNMADAGCSTVAALDLTTGRERWHTPRTPGDVTETFTDMVAVGGGIAVLRDADDMWVIDDDLWTSGTRPVVSGSKALRAFDLRTGAPRWTAAVPKDCVPEQVAAGERQVVAVLACDRTELRLAAFDPADGGQRWTASLGGRTTPVPDGQVALLSAEPAVVRTGGATEGQPGAFLAFGQEGKPVGRIATTGGYGTVQAHTPSLVAVTDGRLYLGVESRRREAYRDRVVAFDLTSGSQVWLRDVAVAGGLRALDVTGGRVTVLADRGTRHDGLDQLRVLDSATGDEKENTDAGVDVDQARQDEPTALLVYQDLVIAVRQGAGVHPFSAYTRE